MQSAALAKHSCEAQVAECGEISEKPRPAGRDKVFALDWRGLAREGILGDVLRLFAFRSAWLREGDRKAYRELVHACRAANEHIRAAAELILSETPHEEKTRDSSAVISNVDRNAMHHGSANYCLGTDLSEVRVPARRMWAEAAAKDRSGVRAIDKAQHTASSLEVIPPREGLSRSAHAGTGGPSAGSGSGIVVAGHGSSANSASHLRSRPRT